MNVYIPTLGRVNKQTTLHSLRGVPDVNPVVVCPMTEVDSFHRQHPGIDLMPTEKTGIGRVRQDIMDRSGERIIMMLDDDLVFAARRKDEPEKFKEATPDEISNAIFMAGHYAKECGHSSIAPREGANRRTETWIPNTRMLRALCYDKDVLIRHEISFTDMDVMEDFYVALSLLTRGYMSKTFNMVVQNQNGSDLPGGCSTYRTRHVQEAAAYELAKYFPAFVKVVEKETKAAWGGGVRKDVVVQWKAAYDSSRAL